MWKTLEIHQLHQWKEEIIGGSNMWTLSNANFQWGKLQTDINSKQQQFHSKLFQPSFSTHHYYVSPFFPTHCHSHSPLACVCKCHCNLYCWYMNFLHSLVHNNMELWFGDLVSKKRIVFTCTKHMVKEIILDYW